MCRISEPHKDSALPSALLSLLSVQSLVPPSGPVPVPVAVDIPENIKAHLLCQAFMQNNNTVLGQAGDLKHKHSDHDTDGEYDDTDDIVLPDEPDGYYDTAVGFEAHDATGKGMASPGGGGGGGGGGGIGGGEDVSRQFECRHCGKRYRWKSTLRRHENVECGGKAPAHQCPYCSYRAKQRGNLGVHIRKHHSSEWYVYATSKVRRNKKTSGSV